MQLSSGIGHAGVCTIPGQLGFATKEKKPLSHGTDTSKRNQQGHTAKSSLLTAAREHLWGRH